MSDADGYKFAKALSDVHTVNNWWDVELIHSIEVPFLLIILLSARLRFPYVFECVLLLGHVDGERDGVSGSIDSADARTIILASVFLRDIR